MLMLFYALAAKAQTTTMKGTVKDGESGEALIGVTIMVKERSGVGTITDVEGNYAIKVNAGETLVFNFIGYQAQELAVSGQSTVNISLLPNAELIEEVVVVGYGAQKKESVVGSIATAKAEDLKSQGNISNVSDALAGSMPGVTVLQSSGMPGGGDGEDYDASAILIRGKNTWNNAAPLILVDGIERNMNDLDINEIESFSVLKDASATAVFGVKGGNGVILVTTKRGSKGKAKIAFEANSTFETISKIPEVLDAATGIQARNYAIINGVGTNPTIWQDYVPDTELDYYRHNTYPYAYPNVNMADKMLKDFGRSHRVNMTARGGTNLVNYFVSLSFNHIGDILATDDYGQGYDPAFSYNRLNFRSNLDFKITKTTKLKVNLAGHFGRQQRSGGSVHSLWHGVYIQAPDWPVIQYEDGVLGNSMGIYERYGQNQFQELNYNGLKRNNRTEVNSDFTLEQDLKCITKGLKISGRIAYDNFYKTTGGHINSEGALTKYIDPAFYEMGGYYDYEAGAYMLDDEAVDMVGEGYTSYFYPDAGSAAGFNWVAAPNTYTKEEVSTGSTRKLYYEARLNYKRKFDVHNVGAMALFSRQESQAGSNWAFKREDWVGRLTYDYDSRYFLEANGAYNGSQKYGPEYRFDFFPSIAVGWAVSNEPFFKDNIAFIEMFKIRYSDGIVGSDNFDAGTRWPYQTIWSTGSYYTQGNDYEHFGYPVREASPYIKYTEGTPGNPDLRWEISRKRNLGFEVNALRNQVAFTADFFNEHRTDMVLATDARNMHEITGAEPSPANLGELKAQGAELQLTLRKTHDNTLNYWASGNWTVSTNKIIEKEDPELKPDYQKAAGYTVGQTKTKIATGIVQSWDDMYSGVADYSSNAHYLPGDFRLLDYNANGVIDPDDGVPYGYSTTPMNTYGFSFGGGYKGFALSLQFYGIYNVTTPVQLQTFGFNSPIIYQETLDDSAMPEYGNDNPTLANLNYNRSEFPSGGHYNQRDGSMLRLKTAELSYSLPTAFTQKFKVSNMRFYVNGNNIWLWSKLPVDIQGRAYNIKNYPVKKSFTLGLNVQF